MSTPSFYEVFANHMRCPSRERYTRIAGLHTELATAYLNTLRSIDDDGARRIVPDGRTVADVVAHVLEWERYTFSAFCEIAIGVRWPGLMRHQRFVLTDGTEMPHASVDEFNAKTQALHHDQPWSDVRQQAIQIATALQKLCVHSGLITPELLDSTAMYKGADIARTFADLGGQMPVGYFLWMIILEHIGVEHREDLALGVKR